MRQLAIISDCFKSTDQINLRTKCHVCVLNDFYQSIFNSTVHSLDQHTVCLLIVKTLFWSIINICS